MSVTINGTVCYNCYDVDWAKKTKAEDNTKKLEAEYKTKKLEVEAARKAKPKEATAPPGPPPDISSGPDQTSGLPIGNPAAIASATSSEPGSSINIFA